MKIRPSKLGKKRQCTRFDYKQSDPNEPNDAAAKGTLLHEAFATGNFAGLSEGDVIAIEAARVQSDGFAASLPQPVETFTEIQLAWTPLSIEGTADKVYVSRGGKRALVSDLKSGFGGLPDDADDSEQVLCYILGAFEKFPEIEVADGILFNPVTREVSDRMTVNRADIPKIEARLRELINRIEDPFDAPTPGSHCCDCNHVARCPAMVPTLRYVGTQVWPLTPADLDPTNVDMDPGIRSVRAILRKYLESWCDAVKEADNASGITPPGWKRIEKAGAPQIPKENRVAAFLKLLELGLSTEVIYGCARMTIGDVIEQYRIVSNLEKEEAKTAVYDALKGLTTCTPSSYIQRDKSKNGLSDADVAKMLGSRQLKGG